MPDHLGIDFGTTNSVVAQLVEEPARVALTTLRSSFGEDRVPSAVAVDRDGHWLFGRAAKEADAVDKVLSVKRVLGAGERFGLAGVSLRPEYLAALLFRHLHHEAAKRLDEPPRTAVVTVPANSKGLQRNATKVAAAAAGWQVLTLINEPTAAAMAYGLGRAASGGEAKILVYDFGGGTFDVTVLRAHHGIFEELSSRGLHRCGGDDLDAALAAELVGQLAPQQAAVLAEPYPALRLRLACEQAKIGLGESSSQRVDLEQFAPGVSLHATIDRALLQRLAAPLIERTGRPVRDALSAAGLLPSELDHVLLVGGSSRLPAVREFLENLLNRAAEPFDQVDPMTCVAQGAAIVAGILQGAPHLDDLDYQVCLEHSLCTAPVDPLTGRRYLEPVIEHGTKIPSRNRRAYLPVADFSAAVTVAIWEGNDYDQPGSEENVRLGELSVPLEPPRPSDDCLIEVEFEYREDGLLTASARDVHAGRTFSEVLDYHTGQLTAAEQMELRALLSEVFGEAPEVAESAAPAVPVPSPLPLEPVEVREARQRLELAATVLGRLDSAETEHLRELHDQLSQALSEVTAQATIVALDQALAAELLFFDYLL